MGSFGNFTFKYKLAQGAQAEVFLVRRDGSTEDTVLKRTSKAKIKNSLTEVKLAKGELKILTSCQDHPFIVDLVSAFHTEHSLWLELGFARGGTLATLIKRRVALKEERPGTPPQRWLSERPASMRSRRLPGVFPWRTVMVRRWTGGPWEL